jgi:hypothetical protein
LRRVYAGATFTARQAGGGLELLTAANNALANQLFSFRWGVGFFAAWLLLYTAWWVFIDKTAPQPQTEKAEPAKEKTV